MCTSRPVPYVRFRAARVAASNAPAPPAAARRPPASVNAFAPLSAQGLTLIELLLAVSILAIALRLTAPGFAQAITALRSESALREISTLLALARHEALLTGREITVCGVGADGRCSRLWDAEHVITVFEDRDADRQPGPGDRLIRQIRWPLKGGELSWRASLARPYLTFETTGGTWQNGTLYYCPNSRDARQARALVLSHSGRSYMPGDGDGDGIREDRNGRNLRC